MVAAFLLLAFSFGMSFGIARFMELHSESRFVNSALFGFGVLGPAFSIALIFAGGGISILGAQLGLVNTLNNLLSVNWTPELGWSFVALLVGALFVYVSFLVGTKTAYWRIGRVRSIR